MFLPKYLVQSEQNRDGQYCHVKDVQFGRFVIIFPDMFGVSVRYHCPQVRLPEGHVRALQEARGAVYLLGQDGRGGALPVVPFLEEGTALQLLHKC